MSKCASHLRNCPQCKAKFPPHHHQEKCACGTDLLCGNEAVAGYTFCSVHGGPAPSRGFYGLGRAPVTGKRSKVKITEIASKFEEMERNGLLLSQRNAMRIIQMRIQQLAERIDLNDAPERMTKIQKLWKEYRELDQKGSQLEARLVAIQIDAEFEAAYHDYMAWEQMFTALDLHKKMTESEAKIIKDMRAVLTAEDATLLMAKVMSVILEVLRDDPKRLKAVQYGLTRIITETGERTGGGSRESRSIIGSSDLDREGVFDT